MDLAANLSTAAIVIQVTGLAMVKAAPASDAMMVASNSAAEMTGMFTDGLDMFKTVAQFFADNVNVPFLGQNSVASVANLLQHPDNFGNFTKLAANILPRGASGESRSRQQAR